MKIKQKFPKDSKTIQTNLVLPNDTNTFNNMFGGELLAQMDRVSSICSQRHAEQEVVTASVNNVSFNQPIPLGSIVTMEAKISRAFSSSMEVFVDVWIDNPINGTKVKCNEGIYTFVAIDQFGRPLSVPQLVPETEIEKERFESALRRKQLSLITAGKMDPKDAKELKAIFYS